MAIDDVSDLSRRVRYNSGAGQTAFTYPFRIFDEADLKVYVDDILQTLGIAYNVTGVDNDTGGSVVFLAGLSAGQIVTIYSDTEMNRDTDYQQNGPWGSARLNSEFDKLMVIAQELRAKLARALRGSVLGNTVAELPSAADRASKYLYFNAGGDPTVVTGDPSQPITHSVYPVYPLTGDTVIPVPADYVPGSYDLSVFKNGLKLVVGDDYAETSANSITLVIAATTGDVIEFDIGHVFDVTMAKTARVSQFITGITGTTLTLTTISYTPGSDDLDIFYNGSRLNPSDYTETNSTTITLASAANSSDEFLVSVGRVTDVLTASRSQIGAALYPITAAEIAAGVTPTDYSYPPGDVRRYGAVGDGVTDDYTALQAAINVAQLIAADVLVTPGVYKYSQQLVITAAVTFKSDSRPGPRVYANPLTAYGGAELVYTGAAATSTDPASFGIKVDVGAIGAEGNAQVSIRGIGLSWTDVNAGGIYVEGAARVDIEDNWFCGGKTGADAGTLTGISVFCRDMILSKIENNRFNYVAYGIVGDDYFNENVIDGNDFEYVTTLPVGIFSATNTSIRNTISNNNFIGLGATPCPNAIIIAGDVQQTAITNNTFEVVRAHTVLINQTNPLTAAALAGTPVGTSVKDNTFIACGGGLAGSSCLQVSVGDHVTFADNTVKSASGPMTALVNISASAANVFLLRNSPDAVPALWSGNPPTFADDGLYRGLPLDSAETSKSGWNNDNLGAMWVNSSTTGAYQRAPRLWNGTRAASVKTGGSRIDATSDATPEVRGISALLVNPAAPYTITYFDEGYTGQSVTVYNQSANNVTIDCTGTNILSFSGANITLGINAWRRFELLDGTVWVET